jgi:hypothetical protein
LRIKKPGKVVTTVSPVLVDQLIDYFAIVSDGFGERLLLVHNDGDSWSLPRWKASALLPWQQVDHVNRTILNTWGLKVTTLRCLCNRALEAHPQPCRIYEMETHGFVATTPPVGCRWITLDELDTIDIAEPGHRLLLHSWFAEGSLHHASHKDAPWRNPGWIAQAVSWMLDQLKRLAIETTGPVEQVRISHRSATLRVPTTAGLVFMRAHSRTMDMNERLLQWENLPWNAEFMPAHLAFDERQNWCLVRAPGSGDNGLFAELSPQADLDEQAAALAHMQQNSIRQVAPFLQLGLTDRRLHHLAHNAESLPSELAQRPNLLTRDERKKIEEVLPLVVELCSILGSIRLPAVLEHGDFTAGSVPSWPAFVFLDWSESCCSHPFFRFNANFAWSPNEPEPAEWIRAREMYLAEWSAYGPIDKLREACVTAQTLAPLHYALFFTGVSPENAEDEWEANDSLRYYLRLFLSRVYIEG